MNPPRIAFLPTVEDRLASIEERLERGSDRMDSMQDELSANTAVTTEVRDLLTAGKGGLKVLGWFGVFAKWLGGIATAIAALWALYYAATHGGQLPK
jgi:hypothetical protein